MTLALACPAQLRTPNGAYVAATGFPKFVWDFAAGYRNAGFAVHRNSEASSQTMAGSFAVAPPDSPRFTPQRALLLEPAAVNLAAVLAAPTDTSGLYLTGAAEASMAVVDDAEALATAGLLEVTGGRAFLLDNSAGSSNARLALQATVDSSIDWVLSAFVRSDGTVSLRTGYGGYPAIGTLAQDPVVNPSHYVRAVRNATHKGGGSYNPMDSIWFDVSPGARLWISCPQWEPDRLIPSSPIFRTASQTTRAAETLFLQAQGPISQITAITPQGAVAVQSVPTTGGVQIAPFGAQILQINIT